MKTKIELKENQDGTIVSIGHWYLYDCDDLIPASKWVREEVKRIKTNDAPQLTCYNRVKNIK